jgi:hypothetical protein
MTAKQTVSARTSSSTSDGKSSPRSDETSGKEAKAAVTPFCDKGEER